MSKTYMLELTSKSTQVGRPHTTMATTTRNSEGGVANLVLDL
jgi:hypothetical protein